MKKAVFAVLSGAVFSAMLAGASYAQGPGPGMGGPGMGGPGMGGPGMMMQADANKDGKITVAEAKASREARFATLDANNSGFVEAAELGQGAPMMLPRMDADKDGKISKAEFTDTSGMFANMDKNKDGAIDQAEMAAMPRPPG